MAQLKKDAPTLFVTAVKAVEEQADECYKRLRLLRTPRNLAIWALLTGTVALLENEMTRWGSDSAHFQAALINLSRTCAVLIRWIATHGKRESRLIQKYRWTEAFDIDVDQAKDVGVHYSAFENCFPMWHRHRLLAEFRSDRVLRFTVPGGTREKQVSAYHKGFRPSQGKFRGIRGKRIEQTDSVKHLFAEVTERARSTGSHKFGYAESPELVAALMPEYQGRVNAILRRADSVDLGGYSMGEFKNFYTALLVVCAIHEHLCYLWGQMGNKFPLSSAVMVKRRSSWTDMLAGVAGLSHKHCEQMLKDLTLRPDRAIDLHVQPFVPLDRDALILALPPQYPLNSRWDENILRTCSYIRPEIHAIASNEKESEMRAALVAANTKYRIGGPVKLTAPYPDIDFIAEDLNSSTVVIAELKWVRKPLKPLERIDRDAEVLHGVDQLCEIKRFLLNKPEFLMHRGELTMPLREYEHLHYLLVARDHWLWVQPQDEIAVTDFDPFRRLLHEADDLHSAVAELLRYAWLPVEGQDFRVQFDRAIANGVAIESEVFYPCSSTTHLVDSLV